MARRAGINGIASAGGFTHDVFMHWLFTILEGLSAGLRVHESPLYRYPYRNAAEAFRGDTKRIAGDIDATMESTRE